MKEMNQYDYSNRIKIGLEQEFPEFSNYYRFQSGAYIVEYPSLKNELILWVSAQNCELAVGFDKAEKCIWHTHMSLFGAYEPESELEEAVKLLKRILSGEEKIVIDDNDGICVTQSIDHLGNGTVKTWKDF